MTDLDRPLLQMCVDIVIFVTHSDVMDDDCICSVLLCEHVPTWPKFNV